jgi:uncharacterized membrane protein YsdA (DUF1294 family)
MGHPSVMLLLVVAGANVIAWAALRLDKLCARRDWRRISERTLLALMLFGGSGALLGMYAHRQRHKTQKTSFVVVLGLALLLQLAALAYAVYLFTSRGGWGVIGGNRR